MADHKITFQVIQTVLFNSTVTIDETLWLELFGEAFDPATVSGERIETYVDHFDSERAMNPEVIRSVWKNANATQAERQAADEADHDRYVKERQRIRFDEAQRDEMFAGQDLKFAQEALREIAEEVLSAYRHDHG